MLESFAMMHAQRPIAFVLQAWARPAIARFASAVAVLGLSCCGWCQEPDAGEGGEPPEAEAAAPGEQPPAEGDAASADSDGAGSDKGIQLFAPRRLDMEFGMRFDSNNNFCTQLFATIAFPIDWPEQKVTLTGTKVPPVASWQFRELPINSQPLARQILMSIPGLPPDNHMEILFEVQIEKSFINPPTDTSIFRIPKKTNTKELNWHMGNSPMIDANASDIKRIAKSIKESNPPDAWSHVERIYDWVRNNIEYRNGTIRNTREAMKDKKGDCEEMSGIFIAICRASGIPARCVWIPEHCYPEFYLEDDEGKGHWFPCQVAGDRQFGQMHDYRPILQKGDRFKVPEKQGLEHYVSQFFKCQRRPTGPVEPSVEPVLDLGPLQQEIDQMQAEVRGRRE